MLLITVCFQDARIAALRALFKKLDANCDNTITVCEANSAHCSGQLTSSDWKQFVSLYYAYGSACQITYAQFCAYFNIPQ